MRGSRRRDLLIAGKRSRARASSRLVVVALTTPREEEAATRVLDSFRMVSSRRRRIRDLTVARNGVSPQVCAFKCHLNAARQVAAGPPLSPSVVNRARYEYDAAQATVKLPVQ